jgi:hypothetical protein
MRVERKKQQAVHLDDPPPCGTIALCFQVERVLSDELQKGRMIIKSMFVRGDDFALA